MFPHILFAHLLATYEAEVLIVTLFTKTNLIFKIFYFFCFFRIDCGTLWTGSVILFFYYNFKFRILIKSYAGISPWVILEVWKSGLMVFLYQFFITKEAKECAALTFSTAAGQKIATVDLFAYYETDWTAFKYCIFQTVDKFGLLY